MHPPLEHHLGCGWLWEVGSPVPRGYSDLLTAAHDPLPPAPLRCPVLAYVHQDFGKFARSAIQEGKDIGIKYA